MPSVPINEVLPNLNGCTIAHYQVLDLVGSGGYGMVYRVLDKRCSKQDPVYHAIKCMRKAKPETRQSTFQMRELALQKVVRDHPNIVTLLSVFSDDQHLYAVMDLCPGGDLFSAIVERRVYHRNNTLIKKAFCQLLDALQYCHARSIYHRDIKPENIMCTSDGANVYLADFGLATTTRVSEEFGCGSKYYMSPECINQEFGLETYSLPESDVWALGVILCNLISAQNPWRFATTDDERFAGYLQDPIFLRRMLRISHGANRVLRRIFTLNPRDRVTIPELREQILKLDSLFMHEQEAVEDADGSNLKTPILAPKAEASPCLPKIVINGSSVSRSSTVSPGSAGSGIFSLRANPSVANLPALIDSSSKSSNAADPVIQDLRNVLLESGIQVGVAQAAQRSASSGPSTGAPGTPAVYAVDPGVEVQELAEEEGLGGQRLVVGEPNTLVKAKEGSRSSRFLKFAMKGLRRAS